MNLNDFLEERKREELYCTRYILIDNADEVGQLTEGQET